MKKINKLVKQIFETSDSPRYKDYRIVNTKYFIEVKFIPRKDNEKELVFLVQKSLGQDKLDMIRNLEKHLKTLNCDRL